MTTHRCWGRTAVLLLFSAAAFAQSGTIEARARKDIDAGNQAWIDAMKAGNAALVGATYADDAVDCSAAGDCIKGRTAIEAYIKSRMAAAGRATSASVKSVGSVQQGDFVFEWGQAEASFSNGTKVVDHYLTAWRREPGGEWKIFRNMPMPEGKAR